MRKKRWSIEETTLHKDGSFAVLNVALEKEGGKRYYNTGYSYFVTHPGTNFNERGLTLLSGPNMLLSLRYGDSTLNVFFKFPR